MPQGLLFRNLFCVNTSFYVQKDQ